MVWGCINIEGSGDLGVKSYLLPANSLVFSTTRAMVDFHGLKQDRFKRGQVTNRRRLQKSPFVTIWDLKARFRNVYRRLMQVFRNKIHNTKIF